MNLEIKTLVTAIISFVNGRGGAITKTKLLKLLYLFDIEYFQLHEKTFTGFDWKFFHLGPWAAQFDSVLNALIEGGEVVQQSLQSADFEVALLRTKETVELKSAIPDIRDEIQLDRILIDWGCKPTGELLDYVYFRTEPMERGVRNERLDFTSVLRERMPRYKRTCSETKPSTIQRKKREFQARLANLQKAAPAKATITPAKYNSGQIR
jgi:hypothetical protein